MLADLPPQRWPFHPRPYRFERIDNYVLRLVELYQTTLSTFSRIALGEQIVSIMDFADAPPRGALERLSTGTGVPIHRLMNMTTSRTYARLQASARRMLRHDPEIVHKALSSISGRLPFVDTI